jgi:hypothetical protein
MRKCVNLAGSIFSDLFRIEKRAGQGYFIDQGGFEFVRMLCCVRRAC